MTPEQEGRDAALKGWGFKMCPYTYGNSMAQDMEEYVGMGYGAKRDQWFKGWSENLQFRGDALKDCGRA